MAADRSFDPDDALSKERRLRDVVVSTINEGVLALAADGRFVFANAGAARLLAFASPDEMTAATRYDAFARWDVYDEASVPMPFDELPVTRALRGESNERVMRLRNKETLAVVWVQFQATPVRGGDGAIELVVCVLRDITQSRQRDQGQRLLAEASAVLGSSLDYEATLRAVAQLAVPRLADWCAVEMRTPGGSEQLAVTHVDPEKIELAWQTRRRWPPDPNAPHGVPNVLRTGQPELYPDITDEMLVATCVDAEQLAVTRAVGLRSALIVPIVGARGTLGAISLIAAESGRRYGQAELTLATELAARAALAVDNSLLYGDAQRAIRLRDDFLSVAGHELRTPLTAMQLKLQGLLRNVRKPGALPVADLADRLERATGHVGRLERLINELLDVSRITTGRMVMDAEEMDLSALAREVVERFGDDDDRLHTPLRLTAPAPVVGRWDRLRLDQVLTNLVANALKYGAGAPVDLEVTRDGVGARLVVRDRGIGIGAADQERIFGRFERAVSKRHYGGLGLGLWIVRQIVEAHDGRIAVTSAPGVETVFTVDLP
jgi:signal transduction histidine kinase